MTARDSPDALEAQLRDLSQRNERLKAEVQELRTQADRLRTQLRRLKDKEQGCRAKLKRAQRYVAPPNVLPGILARRRTVFPSLASATAAAVRQRQFAAACTAYREDARADPSDSLVTVDSFVMRTHAMHPGGVKLPWEVIERVRALTVGGIMLDIGANVGQTSIPRIILGDFEAVYAAEPDPANYARLRETVDANGLRGFVLPDRVAISSRNGVLHLTQGHYRGLRATSTPDSRFLEVPALTLDAWVDRLGIEIDAVSFVKTDTNGYELDVLLGARSLLSKRVAVWQVELAPSLMATFGTSVPQLTDELRLHFTHFMDMNTKAPGLPVRPIDELTDAVAYLGTMGSRRGKDPQTELLCFNQ